MRCHGAGGALLQRKDSDSGVSPTELRRHLVIKANLSRDRGDALLAARGVTRHAAGDWTANVVLIGDLAVIGVEYHEIAAELTSEN